MIHSWKNIVIDGSADGLYSNVDIFHLDQNCKYIFHFLDTLIKLYHNYTITHCAEIAIAKVHDFESSCEIDNPDMSVSAKTIMRCHKSYLVNNASPSSNKANGTSSLPRLLNNNPEIKDAVICFCNENLSTLTGKLLHNYILEKCIQSLLKSRQCETGNNSMTMSDLFKENH